MSAVPAGLGRRPDLASEIDHIGEPGLVAARVLAPHTDRWLVAVPQGDAAEHRLVAARGRLRDAATGPPVAGDWVALDAGGAIAHVLERRGVIVRRASGDAFGEQVLAANVDLALIAEPLPDPNARRIERLAALASTGDVAAMLVLTKADLHPEPDAVAWRTADAVGLADAAAVSVRWEDGVDDVRARLSPGDTAVLLGPSGAGKSTLANALLGAERQATEAVRASDARGRHTTVTRELFALPGGALLIDTPGLRLVRLWEGTGGAFADIDALAERCRFADCRHEREPGCAVRDAVAPERLAAWRKLQREQAWVDDRRAMTREREARGRAHWRLQREARRAKGGR